MTKQVTAFQGYAIFANYDGEAPDTADKLFLATRELAGQVCSELNKDPQKYGNLAYVEGFEHCKGFEVREVILLNESDFATSFEDAMALAEGD